VSDCSATILPFSLKNRWIVTVESERHFIKVRHNTRWYTVARRIGHDERRQRWASRADALVIAEWQREAFERMAWAEQFQAMLDRLPPIQREKAMLQLRLLAGQD
jgi:hypothetical protein